MKNYNFNLMKNCNFNLMKTGKIIRSHDQTRPAWAGFKTAEEGRTKIM